MPNWSVSAGEPVSEPATLEELKAHLRVDGSTDDALIMTQAIAARELCEKMARRAFLTQTRVLTLDAWPADRGFWLPFPPIQSVTSVTYTDEDGNESTWSASNYVVDTTRQRIVVKRNASYPTDTLLESGAIQVTYVAGYSPSALPERYRQAVMLLTGHFYENREQVFVGQGYTAIELPLAVRSLLNVDRGGWF